MGSPRVPRPAVSSRCSACATRAVTGSGSLRVVRRTSGAMSVRSETSGLAVRRGKCSVLIDNPDAVHQSRATSVLRRTIEHSALRGGV